MGQGVPEAAALTFLLAAPAVNPIVLVATAVAFPDRPAMVGARLLGSMATAVAMGLLWTRFGRSSWIAERARRAPAAVPGESRWWVFAETARHDLVQAGGFLVLGGLTSAVLTGLVPSSWLDTVADHLVLGIVVMAVLAVVLSLCSEADAFVAASLSTLPFPGLAEVTLRRAMRGEASRRRQDPLADVKGSNEIVAASRAAKNCQVPP